jgi:outer membrane protein OmpA-like peptidoglycan-associated protein
MPISSRNIEAIQKALAKKTPQSSLSTLISTDAAPIVDQEVRARQQALSMLRGERETSIQKVAAYVFAIFCVIMVIGLKARANVVGSDIDFVTVQSSETLEPGILNFGLFLNYAVNTMPNYENTTTQRRTKFEDSLLGADLNFGIGLADNWDFGMSFPQVVAQDSKDNAGVFSGEISQTGLTEIRLNSKYRLWGDQKGGVALVGSINFNRVEDNPFTGTDPGPTYNIEAAWDTTINRYAWGVNFGYRKREPDSQLSGIPIEPYKDSFIASTAVSYLLQSVDTKLIGEIYGSFPTEKQNSTTDRDLSTMELLLGVKKDLRHDLALHAGGGTELYHGSSTPDWRIYTGINWNIGPVWKKGSEDKTKSRFFSEKAAAQRENFVIGDVLFDTGSDVITPEFQEILKDLADYLRQTGFEQLVIEGHTDSVGKDSYNLDLSQRRADAAVRYLVDIQKISANKVKGLGFGEERPIAGNDNYQGRARNRRIEFNVTR